MFFMISAAAAVAAVAAAVDIIPDSGSGSVSSSCIAFVFFCI